MRIKRKNNKCWEIIGIVAIIIVIFGACIYFGYDKFMDDSSKNKISEKKDNSNDNSNDVVENDDENVTESDSDSDTQTTYDFETQTGDNVSVEANKMVEATGFAGASNYKFYLRGTTLYFLDTSDANNKEEIIAYNVKDLYLENKEVTAELGANGRIVKENNYVTYK